MSITPDSPPRPYKLATTTSRTRESLCTIYYRHLNCVCRRRFSCFFVLEMMCCRGTNQVLILSQAQFKDTALSHGRLIPTSRPISPIGLPRLCWMLAPRPSSLRI